MSAQVIKLQALRFCKKQVKLITWESLNGLAMTDS
jgi:hypothetical protein